MSKPLSERLLNYCQRFKPESYKFTKPKKFYTQLTTAEYATNLPYLSEVEKFCQRVTTAIANQEKICIYTDYDTDAITATATMYWGLREFGVLSNNLDFYAPDRFTEGYGMNLDAIEFLSKYYDLIISVDCGINSLAEAEKVLEINDQLKQKGSKNLDSIIEPTVCQKLGFRKNSYCDLIVTDHHHLHGSKPRCLAVCNPRLSSQNQEWIFNLEFSADTQAKILSIQKNRLKKETLKQKAWQMHYQTNEQGQKSRTVRTENFLSNATTGVGVAWFCLVWLGYYLQELLEISF